MALGEYLVGLLVFAAMLGGVGWGSRALLRARLAHLRGADRAIALGVLVTLGVLAVHLVPMVLGVLGRLSVLVATAAWVAAARAVPATGAAAGGEPEAGVDSATGAGPATGADPGPGPPPGSGRARALSGVAVGGAIVLFLLALGNRLTEATDRIDALNFHLPMVGAWIGSGSIWQIDVYLPDVAPGHYPGNGDVILLSTVLPWRSDFLVTLAMYPFLVLSGVAVYALARELRAPRSAAVMAGCLLAVTPSVSSVALRGGLVDTVMVFGFAAGLLFLLRHHRTDRLSDLVLAGLALGIAFGTKWYAVSSVPIVVAVWLVARLLARRGLGRVVREGAQVTGLVLLGGGIWLVRNLVESANPFFPVKLELLGITIFDAPPDRIRAQAGFTIFDYLGEPSVWADQILPQYRYALAAPAALAALGVVLVGVELARTGRARAGIARWGAVTAGVVCALALTAAYGVTPYTAGGPRGFPLLVAADARYVIPALVVALPLVAWLAGRRRRGPVIFGAVGLFAVFHGLHQTRNTLAVDFPLGDAGHVALVLLVVLGAAAAVLPALAPLQGAAERRALIGVGAALAVVVAIAGFEVQRVFMDKRYAGVDPVLDAVLEDARHERRSVGLVGLWSDSGLGPPLIAYGPRYENRVSYVGRPDRELLRRHRDGPSLRAALRRGGYDLIVIGRGRIPRAQVREERWARGAGYRRVASGPRLVLMAAPGVELARDEQGPVRTGAVSDGPRR